MYLQTLTSLLVLFNITPIEVVDVIFKIDPREEKIFHYKFAPQDTILINANVLQGNDISKIIITEWPASIKFQAYAVRNIDNKKIVACDTSIYVFKLKNTALLSSKTYHLSIQRIPPSKDMINFNTAVKWDTVYDTTYVTVTDTILTKVDTVPETILKRQTKIGAGSRVSIPIYIPPGTIYWVYWIGVGQEAVEGLKKMAEQIPEAVKVLGIIDPVEAFALNILSELFSLNQGLDINYYFLSEYNRRLFMVGKSFRYYKGGERIITDYTKMTYPKKGIIYLGLDNSYSLITSKIVTINAVTAKIKPKYEIHKVQKPVIKYRIILK